MDNTLAAVGNNGGVVVLTHNDKQYTVHQLNDRIRAKLTLWIRQFVVAENRKLKPLYTPEEYRQLQADLGSDLRAGKYNLGTEESRIILGTADGAKAFVRTILGLDKITDEELDDLVSAKGSEIELAIKTLNGTELDDEPDPATADGTPPDPKA